MKIEGKLLIFLSFLDEISSFKTAKEQHLVIEEEETPREPRILHETSRQDLLCSFGSSCVPLSECQLMNQLLKQSCLQTDKLQGLTCGYQGSELLICCPQTCPVQNPSPGPGHGENCGQPKLTNWWSSGYSGLGSQPWAVRVGFKNKLTDKIDYLCGGSIVGKRTILTAAHCALAKTTTHRIASVRVGEYDYNQDPDCMYGFCAQRSIDIPLNHVIVHPNYDSKTFSDNIALLILKTPLNFSVSVQPICIYPKSHNYIYVDQTPTLIGWGKLARQTFASSTQQQIKMPVIPIERCATLYGSVPITEKELCVGGQEGRAACSGFGGAPLVLLDPHRKSQYYQIGLLSFASDQCGAAGIPSVFTRVDRYSDWIEINSPKI